MVYSSALRAEPGDPGGLDLVGRLAATEGSAAHQHCRRLADPATPLRDLSDAVHALCAVHGRHPGMAEQALLHRALPAAGEWLGTMAQGFAAERTILARLASAAGPQPSTPGQAGSEAALAAQRHALSMLARSDRRGCALGAMAALALDWIAIRPFLASAAERLDLPDAIVPQPPILDLPPDLLDRGAERAFAFGAQQVFAQARGFWGLMAARAAARG